MPQDFLSQGARLCGKLAGDDAINLCARFRWILQSKSDVCVWKPSSLIFDDQDPASAKCGPVGVRYE